MSDPSHVDRFNAVVDLLLRQAEDDMAVLTAARRARELRDEAQADAMLELDDNMLAALGWTRQELIIARDARRGRQQASVYLMFAQERTVTRMRAAGDQQPTGNKQAIGYVLPVQATRPALAPIDVDPEDIKDP